MSILGKDSIKVIAEGSGISNLKDEVAEALAPDVEYRIRDIIQEAMKFMKHSKREVLTTDDINYALRLRNVEPLYGFSSREPPRFCRALGTTDVYYIEDREVELDKVINMPLPKVPFEPTFTAHWLAVDGKQPTIPQNPTAKDLELNGQPAKKAKLDSQAHTAADSTAGGTEVKPLAQHVLSKELQLYYDKVTAAIQRYRGTSASNEPTSKHADLLNAALKSVSQDPGLHQMTPYFSQFIGDEVTRSLRDLPYLMTLMRLANALLISDHIHIEPYLHQLMPCILTCLVGKRLCSSAEEDHWSLRDYCARMIALVCRRFGNEYVELQPRITKTLLHALLDSSKPLTTHYGAIVGLHSLGPLVTHMLLMPNLHAYLKLLKPELDRQERNSVRRKEALRVYGAYMRAAGTYLFKHTHLFTTSCMVPAVQPEVPSGSEVDGDGEAAAPAMANGAEKANGAQKANGGSATQAALKELLPQMKHNYQDLYEEFGEGMLPFLQQVEVEKASTERQYTRQAGEGGGGHLIQMGKSAETGKAEQRMFSVELGLRHPPQAALNAQLACLNNLETTFGGRKSVPALCPLGMLL